MLRNVLIVVGTSLLLGVASCATPNGPARVDATSVAAAKSATPDAVALIAEAEHALDNRELAQAASLAQRALAAAESTSDLRSQSTALRILSAADAIEARGDDAAEKLERAIRLADQAHALSERGRARVSLGNLAIDRGDPERAVALIRLGIADLEAARDGRNLARAYITLGTMIEPAGKRNEALELYRRALAVAREVGDIKNAADASSNIGQVYMRQGHYQESITVLEEALATRRSSSDVGGEDYDLFNLGANYYELRILDRALDNFRQSLNITKGVGDQSGQIDILSAIGLIQAEQKQYAESEASHRQAIQMAEAADYPKGIAYALKDLGDVQRAQGQPDRAIESYRRSLQYSEQIGDIEEISANRVGLSEAYLALGRPAEAQAVALDALIAVAGVQTPELEWQANYEVFRSLLDQKAPGSALVFGKQAIRVLQSVRSANAELAEGLKASYIERVRDVYERVASTLIAQNRLAEAEQVLDMLKTQEYHDFLRGEDREDAAEQVPVLSRMEGEWTQRFLAIQDRIVSLGEEYEALKEARKAGPVSAVQEARYTQIQADLVVARRGFDQALEKMIASFAKASPTRIGEIAEKQLRSLAVLQGTLRRIGPGVGIVHYIVADDRLHVLFTSPNSQVARESAIGEAELGGLVLRFRQALRNPHADPLPLAQELYGHLIAPIRKDLEVSAIRTLMVSLDRSLRYIPIAALYDGQHWLVEDYALSVYTAAAATGIDRPNQPDWKVAGLGFSRGTRDFSELPAVPYELDNIVRDQDDPKDLVGELPGVVRLDDAFTTTSLTDLLERSYPVVHIASHFNFRPGAGLTSFLLLGDGQRLTLDDFKVGTYPLVDVDLLTLSACETAVGELTDDGVEIEGFGALAQDKGAKGVLASLWAVGDASTGLLMQSFYRLRQHDKLNKAEALRRAQIAFISGKSTDADMPIALRRGTILASRGATRVEEHEVGGYVADPVRPLAHPFYWAPFILMGNWL